MIKLLKRFVDWLEVRFPAKVVLTETEYLRYKNYVEGLHKLFEDGMTPTKDTLNRVKYLEKTVIEIQLSIAALKEGIVKGEIKPALGSREQDRQAFINGDLTRLSGINRKEIEAIK